MLKEVDLGNHNVKTENLIFQSKICKDKNIIKYRKENDPNLVNFENQLCLVGEGDFQTDTNKLDKELYKICFLTALARSTDEMSEEFKVVTGLPAVQYTEKNIDRIKNEMLKEKFYEFTIGGTTKNIILQDIEVFPESAAPYYGMTPEQKKEIKFYDLIMVNMGGGNTNIAYFKYNNGSRKLMKNSTVMDGSLNLYNDFISAINGEFSIGKTLEDAENILKYGLEIYGEKQDLSFTKDIILEHLDKIFKEINLYPIKTSKVMFTGGGCNTFKPLLKHRIPNCLFQTNYLTATATGLKRVGESIWQKEYR